MSGNTSAVMSSRSLTEAAGALHISQPALSKAVKRLEDRLRLPLFHRVNGRLRPTRFSHVRLCDSFTPSEGALPRGVRIRLSAIPCA